MRQTMRRSGMPTERVHLVKGRVEHTLLTGDATLVPNRVAVARLDTDMYQSTRIELSSLWPRLEPGGWLFVDDYYVWPGARRAVDEWLAARNWTLAARSAHAFGFDERGRKLRNFIGKARSSGKRAGGGAKEEPAWPFRAYRSGVP